MSHVMINPPTLHDPTAFGYSHTASVSGASGLVFVAGQYASNRDGRVVSNDFADQVKSAIGNLAVALAAHDLELAHVVQLRTYVVGLDFDKLGAIAQAIGAAWGSSPPTQTLIGVASLAMPEIQFEVEAIAARPD